MKPAPFVYEAPATLDEALTLMAEHGDHARVLAGGQSLVPAMNMRVARPGVIVDINRIPGLDTFGRDNGVLTVGPLVRHRRFESPPAEGAAGRLISETAHLVAHPPIRTRGTMLGSLAFADPAAEWCAVTQLFDCEVTAASTRGERSLPVDQLLTGAFTNSLAPDEILVEARLRIPKASRGAAIAEQSHTQSDFAVVLAAALLIDGEDGVRHRVVVGGAAPTGRRLRRLEEGLNRDAVIAKDIEAIGELISDELDPPADAYGSSGYRARLAAVLIARALKRSGVVMSIELIVNGIMRKVTVEARHTLADVLRGKVGSTGTHLGCEHGVCGACTVLFDDEPIRSCLIFAVQCHGHKITTVEGLAPDQSTLHPLQEAFHRHHALQCGFCTPGFLMVATAALDKDPNMPDAELEEWLASNLCRCTGYVSIVAAVKDARDRMRTTSAEGL